MFCARVKVFLRKQNIAFTDRDITSPVILVDGETVIGYDVNRLKSLLDT